MQIFQPPCNSPQYITFARKMETIFAIDEIPQITFHGLHDQQRFSFFIP
jgi:hypothetical protein